jgi:peptidoglycan L-alanyl-D-glutamate endopeptidase CwlK
MSFILGTKSLANLTGVHEDLVRVVKRAIQLSTVDFRVQQGLRSKSEQALLVKKGASTTMNSRHLTGHAVDLVALIAGEVRWDWPLYYKIAAAMKQAAKDLNVPITWGGDWKFKDGPHFELSWKQYP